MVKKKVCKNCKYIYDGEECPVCKSQKFSNSWQGRLFVLDPVKSDVAKQVNVTVKGEYAIKVR